VNREVERDVERCSLYLNIQTGILGIATRRYYLHKFRENILHRKSQLIQIQCSTVMHNSSKINKKTFLTSLAVQFYLPVGFCSKSGTLATRLASCQCLCISLSAIG